MRHLLTMSSGLYGRGWWDIDELELRGVPVVEGALQAPLVSAPGWGFLYNNGAAHLLSAVMLKLGLLYLHGGRVDGRRVLDEAYAAAATSALLNAGPPEFGSYGLLWWVDHDVDPKRFFSPAATAASTSSWCPTST